MTRYTACSEISAQVSCVHVPDNDTTDTDRFDAIGCELLSGTAIQLLLPPSLSSLSLYHCTSTASSNVFYHHHTLITLGPNSGVGNNAHNLTIESCSINNSTTSSTTIINKNTTNMYSSKVDAEMKGHLKGSGAMTAG